MSNNLTKNLMKALLNIMISIIANQIHFDYNQDAQVLENHCLNFEVQESQTNKLYGIIGPSGVGKTTFLSILGGQLKPDQGQILINSTNIYEVGDLTRRTLIALQMQTATNLRGTLRYNSTFGLPREETIFEDKEIIQVLDNVGLWKLFEAKKGIETLIGEGGLNLSGGQRQRLNFASLYLRTKYFRPSLILIDEPTSSLDEISEQKITKMMLEMSEKSIVIVIAHRLKTIENATGIMDFSLVSQNKELKFMSKIELNEKSQYYRELMEGKVELE
jgi:ABC-type bacteriocin/lantibiotic exporter with double-glycine peptidase domain